MFQFIQNFFGSFQRGFDFYKGVIESAKGKWIYAILFKWYTLVVGVALVVTYNILKTLHDKGLLERLYSFVDSILQDVVRISVECTQYIDSLERLWYCL